jgi:hypothetical protein
MKTTRETLEEARALEADHNWTAEKILTVLEANNGKKITRRILPRIAAIIGQEVTLQWTASNSLLYIETENYRRNRDACGPGAVKILIPTGFNQSSLPEIDVEEIRERNACYLSAAVERNEARNKLLSSDYPEQCDAAGQAYRDAKAALESLTCYPNPDWTTLQRLQGLK